MLEKVFELFTQVSPNQEQANAILSQHPLRVNRAGSLPERTPRSAEPRDALWVEIADAGRALQVVTTHLGLAAGERQRQIEALLGPGWAGGAIDRGPVVLCGDLNSVPWSRPYRQLGRSFRDAVRGCNEQPKPTFHSRFPMIRIDHVFTTGAVQTLHASVPRTVDTAHPAEWPRELSAVFEPIEQSGRPAMADVPALLHGRT